MNMDREIGKIVLHVQNLLRQIQQEGDVEALAALEATLQIATTKLRNAKRSMRGKLTSLRVAC
ncbi:hypothetical protein RM530_00695 [Algiphilus sp. W345]|uniref:Uncharacterized protein n=1 Tax=Banduia mediterranea TaxID=3075609 RepID=A0ABU2WF17_9GAMM|nr:hypothetical protein [Algiphilus sp. W345]MDT0495886.1 hypothetical protein [Algiphilus sp. W345]